MRQAATWVNRQKCRQNVALWGDAGPPAKLSLGLACTVQQGSTGSLGAVEVAVSDAWGNPVAPGKDFEVTLRPAAIATDGSGKSAKVTARGSNRAKLRGGSATFLDVKLKADTDGEFTLAAYCKSRTLVRLHCIVSYRARSG